MRVRLCILWFLLAPPAWAQFYHTGLELGEDLIETKSADLKYVTGPRSSMPGAKSLKEFCPLPGNQLQMNTSPAWAVCWSAIGTLQAIRNNWTNKHTITNNTYSPAYTYQEVRPDDDFECLSGTSLISVLDAVRSRGGTRYIDYLEFCDGNSLPVQGRQDAAADSVYIDHVALFGSHTSASDKISAVKNALNSNMPVVAGMQCPPSFHKSAKCWQPRESTSGGWEAQALCVVGYDDAQYGGAFEVLNSWGREWGDGGFTWIRYVDFGKFMEIGYGVYMLDTQQPGSMSGSLAIEMANASFMPLELTPQNTLHTRATFDSDMYFRVHLECAQAGFVYVFGSNKKGQVFNLLPNQTGQPVTITGNNVALTIPGKDQYLGITDPSEGDYLCILYSNAPPDVELIHGKAQLGQEVLLRHFSQWLPTHDNMSLLKDAVAFTTAPDRSGSLMLVVHLTAQQKIH